MTLKKLLISKTCNTAFPLSAPIHFNINLLASNELYLKYPDFLDLDQMFNFAELLDNPELKPYNPFLFYQIVFNTLFTGFIKAKTAVEANPYFPELINKKIIIKTEEQKVAQTLIADGQFLQFHCITQAVFWFFYMEQISYPAPMIQETDPEKILIRNRTRNELFALKRKFFNGLIYTKLDQIDFSAAFKICNLTDEEFLAENPFVSDKVKDYKSVYPQLDLLNTLLNKKVFLRVTTELATHKKQILT